MMPRPSASRGLASAESFAEEIEQALGHLTRSHLRISLFAIEAPGVPVAIVASAVRRALSRHGPLGWLPDGRPGLLYIGPRPGGGVVGDDILRRDLLADLRDALRDMDVDPKLCAGADLVASHRWSDEASSCVELLDGGTQRALIIAAQSVPGWRYSGGAPTR